MRSAVLLGFVVLAGCNPVQGVEEGTTTKIVEIPSRTPEEARPNLQALGTEPFWSLEVLPKDLKYSSPENPTGTVFPAAVTKEPSGWRFTGALEGKRVVLLIEAGTCSDGMSDTVYPYKSSFTWGDQTQQGCARLK